MMYKAGLSNITSPQTNNIGDFKSNNTTPVRVIDIIMDENHPDFNKLGKWGSIGAIKFELINDFKLLPNYDNVAFPLDFGNKKYPLVNEIVLISLLPTPNNLESLQHPSKLYYTSILNLWNNNHHNAYPNVLRSRGEYNKTYNDIENGNLEVQDSNKDELNLNSPINGGNFTESEEYFPLLPFEGENIFEGRFGNSIRLGGTSKGKNPWSTKGNNGDPIIIISNGRITKSNFRFITEDINNDSSSVYLTSTQSLPINSSSERYGALKNSPTPISEYQKSQILFTSERLTFNSTKDNILFSSYKNINLSSEDSVGINSRNNINLFAPKVRLGDKNASESIVLGDKFATQFKQLLTTLGLLCEALEKEPTLKITPPIASSLKTLSNQIKNQIPKFLSKTVKSI